MYRMLRPMPLSDRERALREHVERRRESALALLERTVRVNSGSGNLAGIEAVGDLFRPAFEAPGFPRAWHAPAKGHGREKAARSLVARRGRGKKLFLTAHLDTVFEPADGFDGFAREGERAVGPGIVDCKGGVVLMLEAIAALAAEKAAD